MYGWIKLYRKSKDHWIYQEKRPATKREAWEDILLLCNHKEEKVLIQGELITSDRGQSVRSLKTWAKEFRWSIKQVRTFFKLLQSDEMIVTEGLPKTTRLTVCNYKFYQDEGHAKGTQRAHKGHAEGTQRATNKNDKNELINNKNEKKSNKKEKPVRHKHGEYNHVLLTDDEFQRLSDEWGIEVLLSEIKNMDEGIEMKAYSYKNHNLALRKWHKNNKGINGINKENQFISEVMEKMEAHNFED